MSGPTTAEFRAALAAILCELGHPATAADLADHVSLTADLGVDSFHLTEVARRLERQFGRHLGLARWVLEQSSGTGPSYTIGSLLSHVAARPPRPDAL